MFRDRFIGLSLLAFITTLLSTVFYPTLNSNRAVAVNIPNRPAQQVAICIPLLGCVDTPLPDFLEKPLEGVIKGEIYKRLAEALGHEAPIASSAKSTFRTVKSLTGEEFNASGQAESLAKRLILLPDGSVILPAGDYAIPVNVFGMKYSASSPKGHRYLLAPLKGKQRETISVLNSRSVGYGIERSQLQLLSWNIQAGIRYEDMSRENQNLVDALLPDYKDKLSKSYLEQIEETYNRFAPAVAGLPPSIDAALEGLGDIGKTIRGLKEFQNAINQYGDNYDTLSKLLVGVSDRDYKRGGVENTPWSKLNDRVYARFVTEGDFSSPAQLQLRVLGRDSKGKSNKTIVSSNKTAVRVNITNLVADSQSSNIQSLSMSPQLISLLSDVTPVDRAKGILSALLGEELIKGEEWKKWSELLANIPNNRSSNISRESNVIDDAENFILIGINDVGAGSTSQ